MVSGDALPLVRLDFRTNGSIALTNGRIMTRTAGYTAGTEVTETVTMQFYGAGDYTNYSKHAISGDFYGANMVQGQRADGSAPVDIAQVQEEYWERRTFELPSLARMHKPTGWRKYLPWQKTNSYSSTTQIIG